MNPDLVIIAYTETVKLIRTILEGIPLDERHKQFKDFDARMKFWEDLFKKMKIDLPDVVPMKPPGV